MFFYGNFRLFFLKISSGLILTLFSIVLFYMFTTLGYSIKEFHEIRSAEFDYLIIYYFGIISVFLFIFFGFFVYLIPLFFFKYGIGLILGIRSKHNFFKFILLLISIFISNLSFSLAKIKGGGILGETLLQSVPLFFFKYFENKIIFWIIISILLASSLCLILISFSIKIKFIKKLNIFILSLIKKIAFVAILLKYLIPKNLMNSTKTYKSENNKPYLKNFKKEPTIKKNNLKQNIKKNINADSVLKKDNTLYSTPPVSLLITSKEKIKSHKDLEKRNINFAKKLEVILAEYGVEGKIVNYKYGPVVTLYEFLPAAGIKTSKVVGLSDDIARAMSSLSARISSQPGKTSLGIEIPNLTRENVLLGDLINDDKFFLQNSGLKLALGKNISGEKIFTDLEKMPHLLIAGTTGSGKSVGINSMIISLLFRFSPSECKLILIDPKMLELSIYEDIPHLLTPVVTNPNKAVYALKWVVKEMENRYRLMSSLNVKNISSYNNKILQTLTSGRKLYREVQTGIDRETRTAIIERREIPLEKMPLIVVVIDEMADLMMVAGKEVECLVQRLAQMARASGIHLIAATQRPSVDVITGTIKANFPSRISFRVASKFDSRTILNEMGAEQLLGSGDMLFLENGANLTRLHGGFISESEIEDIVKYIKSQSTYETSKDITLEDAGEEYSGALNFNESDVDELYEKAVSIIIDQQKVSTSFIQRYLQIGYNRAARIVEKMEEDGYISEASNSGKRNVLKTNK